MGCDGCIPQWPPATSATRNQAQQATFDLHWPVSSTYVDYCWFATHPGAPAMDFYSNQYGLTVNNACRRLTGRLTTRPTEWQRRRAPWRNSLSISCPECENTYSERNNKTPRTVNAARRQRDGYHRTGSGAKHTRFRTSWIPVAVAIMLPGTFLVTYILAWQLGHIDPILPYISLTGAVQPESCIFSQLLNIVALGIAVVMYVRYRLLAKYMSDSESPHSVRANKAALALGLIAAFGISLVANFQYSVTIAAVSWMHNIGSTTGLALATAYMWIDTVLSVTTLRRLTSPYVRTFRLVLGFVAVLMFVVYTITLRLLYIFDPLWNKVSAATQWTLLTIVALYFLTMFGDFRYTALSTEVHLTSRG